jgi:hypothetical protein
MEPGSLCKAMSVSADYGSHAVFMGPWQLAWTLTIFVGFRQSIWNPVSLYGTLWEHGTLEFFAGPSQSPCNDNIYVNPRCPVLSTRTKAVSLGNQANSLCRAQENSLCRIQEGSLYSDPGRQPLQRPSQAASTATMADSVSGAQLHTSNISKSSFAGSPEGKPGRVGY